MKDGWYAILNMRGEHTLHYVVEKIDASLCTRYKLISQLKDRISFGTFDESQKCTVCEKGLPIFLKSGFTPIELKERSLLAKIKKSHKNYEQKLANQSPLNKIDDKGDWRNTVCPECKTPVIFFNKSRKKEHYCTVCKKLVTLPSVVVAI